MKKNWWSNLSYWLKGGIIGIIISFILHAFIHFYLLNANTYSDCYPGPCYTGNLFSAVFYSPMFYIIIMVGILIGWIYGIIKKKKSK
jgi:ABC-type antimicrobial peptide transport system permease subunit